MRQWRRCAARRPPAAWREPALAGASAALGPGAGASAAARVSELDAARGVAALLVVLHHPNYALLPFYDPLALRLLNATRGGW